jgi:Ca2+-binding RTX toxin-like protein
MHITAGANWIFGTNGNDIMFAGDFEGHDLDGLDGHDTMNGSEVRDILKGGYGNDIIYGNGGVDFILGGSGNNQLFGGSGDDWFDEGTGSDFIDGGTGFDRIDYYHATSAVRVNLSLTTWQQTGWGSWDRIINIEMLFGSKWSDTLIGDSGDNELFGGYGGTDTLRGGGGNDRLDCQQDGSGDVLDGGTGNDALSCGSGNDKIYGGTGNDTIYGAAGQDVMTGNSGADTFFFSNEFRFGPVQTPDRITDFEIGVDKILKDSGIVLSITGIASDQLVLLDYSGDLEADTAIRVTANGILSASDII